MNTKQLRVIINVMGEKAPIRGIPVRIAGAEPGSALGQWAQEHPIGATLNKMVGTFDWVYQQYPRHILVPGEYYLEVSAYRLDGGGDSIWVALGSVEVEDRYVL